MLKSLSRNANGNVNAKGVQRSFGGGFVNQADWTHSHLVRPEPNKPHL